MKAKRLRAMPCRIARMLLAAAVAGSTAAVPAAEHARNVATQCEASVLAALGWRFVEGVDATADVDIVAGEPCRRASLEDAHAHGDLQVLLPRGGIDAPRRKALFASLRVHPATRCAYAFALGDATRRAIDRLVTNHRFRFSALQLGWIGFGASGPDADGWRRVRSFGRGYVPASSNSAAIAGFYTGAVRAECGVGRQVAQLAAQAELYGPDAFDSAFAADELMIGTFNQLHGTPSVLLGHGAGELVADGAARHAAERGRQAFAGLPGFIVHTFPRSYLDDINNQAENFVVYEVSADAAEALRRHGGFAHYNAVNRELWALSRRMNPHAWGRGFERLLIDRDPALRARLGSEAQTTLARMDALLDDPFYRGFRIYVHKLGVKPVGFHIARLLDRNPRTPFQIELALHNTYTTLFERYVADRIRRCAARASETKPGP